MSQLLPMTCILCAYNAQPYLQEAVETALGQEYEGELEYIFVDDCSTDGTGELLADLVERYQGGHDVRLIRNASNLGIARSLDRAMKQAKHEWIVLFDADDAYCPNRCAINAEILAVFPSAIMVVGSLENTDMVGVTFSYRGADGIEQRDQATLPSQIVLATPQSRYLSAITPPPRGRFEQLVDDSPVARVNGYGTAMSFNRCLYDEFGDIDHPTALQDRVLSFRAHLKGSMVGDNRVVVKYRSHSTNLINRSMSAKDATHEIMQVELFWSQAMLRSVGNCQVQMRDIEKSMRDGLSDWTPEQQQKMLEMLKFELREAQLRANWWHISWFVRLFRAITSVGKVRRIYTRWAFLRLMPLSLFAYLKNR